MAPITFWIMNSVCRTVFPPARICCAPPIIPAIKSLKPPSSPVVQRLLQEVEVCPTVAVLLLLDKERDLLAGRTQVNQYPCFYQPVLGTR